ncbi:MAG: DUF86 domain-containing protein [Anaerolineae bacterium]
MKRQRVYADYLHDIVEYSNKAMQFIQGIDFAAFQEDEEKTFAVVRALEVVGEAASHIPASLRDKYPQIPWSRVTGMRNKIIHDYFGVDAEVVWKTVREDLPRLQEQVAEMLADLEPKL